MSQIAVSRPRKSGAPSRPAPLKVVAGRAGEAGRGGFVALCLLALVLGSLSILILNTSRAKGTFELRQLQAASDELTDTQEALEHAISAQSAAGALAQRARRLGMVPNESAAFLRLSDGRILGVAKPAVADPTFSVVTDPSMKPATTGTKKPAGPRRTVTKKGTVTTTTVVTTKTGGVIETVRTSVDSATGRTTTTTTVTTPPKVKVKATSDTKAGTQTPRPGTTRTAGTTTTTQP